MKVKCIAISSGGSPDFSPWLTVGETYHVLSIEKDSSARTWFRIVTNERDPGVDSLGLHRSDNFEIVTQFRPSVWCDRQLGGGIETSPAAWQVTGFWESLYDGDPDAAAIFEKERRAIVDEERSTSA